MLRQGHCTRIKSKPSRSADDTVRWYGMYFLGSNLRMRSHTIKTSSQEFSKHAGSECRICGSESLIDLLLVLSVHKH